MNAETRTIYHARTWAASRDAAGDLYRVCPIAAHTLEDASDARDVFWAMLCNASSEFERLNASQDSAGLAHFGGLILELIEATEERDADGIWENCDALYLNEFCFDPDSDRIR